LLKRLTNFVKKNVPHNAIFIRSAFCPPLFNRYPLVVLCRMIYQQLLKVINTGTPQKFSLNIHRIQPLKVNA